MLHLGPADVRSRRLLGCSRTGNGSDNGWQPKGIAVVVVAVVAVVVVVVVAAAEAVAAAAVVPSGSLCG